MKLSIKIFFPVMLAAILFTGCRPEEFKEIGETRDIPSSLVGTWKLTKVTQKDEESARKGFPYSEIDITTLFPYTQFTLTLVINTAAGLSTFTSSPGSSPDIIGLATGTWKLDSQEAPTKIDFTSGATTQSVALGAYPVGGNTKLKFKVEKRDADPAANNKLLISYTYEFTKQ
jgi:hypothetical protein